MDLQYRTTYVSWSPHISRISGKVNSIQAFFRRNLAHCSRDLKIKSYQTYIRPIIEYAAVVWSPCTQSSIHAVEMLQRKAARFVCNDFTRLSSITRMLEHLGWDTLEQRRNQLILLMLYEIISQLVEVPHHHIPAKASVSIKIAPANIFTYVYSRIDSYKFSFFPRAIRLWNSLPNHVTQQGCRKLLESGEAKHGVISIFIQEVLCSYLIVAETTQLPKAAHARGVWGHAPPGKF